MRLDTAMPDHPKILALVALGSRGKAAAFVWCCSLTYAGKHGTDGLIEPFALSRCNGTAPEAKLLVEYGLWDELPKPEKGWLIHDWADRQESNTETQQRSARNRANALKRWHPDHANGTAK